MSQIFVDFQHLQAMSDGDKAFESELFSLFENDSSERVSAIGKGIAEKDWILLKKELHTLKGAASNVGAIKVRDVTEQMENFCEEKNIEELNKLFENLKQDLTATLDAFHQ
jgi:HPt (histidine-containing phosphotransfer) domain-containing protein